MKHKSRNSGLIDSVPTDSAPIEKASIPTQRAHDDADHAAIAAAPIDRARAWTVVYLTLKALYCKTAMHAHLEYGHKLYAVIPLGML